MRLTSLVAAVALLAFPVAAHDDQAHGGAKSTETVQKPASTGVPVSATPFPVQIDARFSLIDQDGIARTERDYRGSYALVFFGYANCRGICSVALPRIAGAMDALGTTGDAVQPILITVDPQNDTPDAMREALPKIHERFTGLTGSEADLAAARKAFGVETELVFTDPELGPVYRHGGFIYLLGPDGTLLSVMPPILSSGRIAEIVGGHVGRS